MLSIHWVKSSAFGNSHILLSMCYVEIDCILILILILFFVFFVLVYVLVFVFYLINCQIALVRQMLSEPDNKKCL